MSVKEESEGQDADPQAQRIEEIMEKLRPPALPAEVLEKHEDVRSVIKSWKATYAIAVIAGLMTDVTFHVNAIRLDWLLRFVIAMSQGRVKPRREAIEQVLNYTFKTAGITRLEDPIEGVFCDVVPTRRGDRLIFVGHWESAAAHTDTVCRPSKCFRTPE